MSSACIYCFVELAETSLHFDLIKVLDEKSREIIIIYSLGTMTIWTKLHASASNSISLITNNNNSLFEECQGITKITKSYTVRQRPACTYKFVQQSIKWLMRYFSMDQQQWTDQQSATAIPNTRGGVTILNVGGFQG